MSQPILLTGPVGVDLELEAWNLARKFVCSKKVGCKNCEQCTMADRRVHPDVNLFGDGVKELRALMNVTAQTPLHGQRVVILTEVESMSVAGLNTLLKPLEAAPETTHFILTSHWPRRILATILSRCKRVNLNHDPNSLPGKGGGSGPEESLDELSGELGDLLREQGPSSALRRSVMRLRDFYQIKAYKGNVKLARQVVVATLREIDHTLADKYDTD